MSEHATTQPPPKPDNDADGGAKVLQMSQPGHRQEPGGAPPAGDDAAPPDAGWLDAARQEAAHVQLECAIHAEAHFESCARWSGWNTVLGAVSAVLGALTASTIAAVLGEGTLVAGVQAAGAEAAVRAGDWQAHLKPIFAFGALVAGVVAAAVRFLDPSARSTQHGVAGKRYKALGDRARQFRNLEVTAEAGRDGLLNQLRAMVEDRAEIHDAAPVIPKRAYAAARKKLVEAERQAA